MSSSSLHLLLACCVLSGCSRSPSPTPTTSWQEICGRDNGRVPIYRAKVPSNWQRRDPTPDTSLFDSTLSLCEFLIVEGTQQIKITIHNFPTNAIEERIPPSAQIARWKQQFESLDPASLSIASEAYAGFSGLFFEASGILHKEHATIIAFAMQIAPSHYYRLQTSEQEDALKQMRADYTIKAVGPVEWMAQNKQSILAFARSFELIQEIPSRS